MTRAQDERPAFELLWSAPSACRSAAEARDAVGSLIREPREAGERAQARVLIEGSNQRGYVARIDITRGASTGERELRGTSCDSVANAAVLIIAMAIDPEGASARAAAQRQPSPARAGSSNEAQAAAATKPAEVTSSAPRAPEREAVQAQKTEREAPAEQDESVEQESEEDPPSDPRRAGRFVLGLHGTGDAGSFPHATIGGGLLGGMHWQHLRLELQGLAWVSQVAERSTGPGSTDISLYTGAISGCMDVLGARDALRSLGACAALEAGLSRGVPRSLSDGRASTAVWLASFLGLDVRQQLAGPLHVRLRVDAGFPVLRPSYEIDPFGRVFRASPVLGRLAISAFVLFP